MYSGHSGSVNSVRFRDRDNLMLTCSGDGTAHLVALPTPFFEAVAATTTHSVLGASGDLDNVQQSEGTFWHYVVFSFDGTSFFTC